MAEVRVMGLDLAPANSGMCIIEAHPNSGYPAVSPTVLYQEALSLFDNFSDRQRCSYYIYTKALEYKPDVIVIEGYVPSMGRFNTTAYQHAEFVALTKHRLLSAGFKIIIVPPTTMRSFVKIPPKQKDKGKQHIMSQMESIYGFKADYSRKKERSDVTDAFVHSIIGAHVYFALSGILDGEMVSHEKRIILGDDNQEKKTAIVGLINRPEAYIGDWTSNGSTEESNS